MDNAFSHHIFLHKLAQTSPSPFLIEVERAHGIYLYAPDGRRYMDLISGIGVSNLGHGHPRIVKAIKEQVDRHLHVMVYGEFVQAIPNLLVHRLTGLLPNTLNCCYLVNSGTEANEGALKLAKRYTGRTEIVAFKHAYHGSTHGSLSVSGNENKKYAFRPLLPDVRFIRFNEPDDLQFITTRTAGVIMETVQGDAGVRIPSTNFMKALRQRCNETGALLILDEIQCGIGRTGKLFAFEHFGIVPDVLTLGKAFGGGLPIGAFVADKKIMETLTHHPPLGHITTFGGNPVCCAAALATLEALEEEHILNDVERKGKFFEDLIKHPDICAMRRIGLMFAIDFSSADRVNRLVLRAREKGIIVYWFLSHPHSLRLAPPLVITDEEIKEACRLLVEAIDETA
jgi:acetylornithine/succinyldiaminopimelate/putrescine aminotransferase